MLTSGSLAFSCSGGDEDTGTTALQGTGGMLLGASGNTAVPGSGGFTPAGGMGSGGFVGVAGASPTPSGSGGAVVGMGGSLLGMGGNLLGMGGGVLGMGGDLTPGAGGDMLGVGGDMLGMGGMGSRMDLGQGDGQDVITIGDSYMLLLFTGIQVSLERVSGRDYRNYAVPGTRIDQIIGQYEAAKRDDADIKTVIMTGGGNDILFTSCADEGCKSIVDTVQQKIVENLQPQFTRDGVEDVIIVGYGYPADTSRHWSLEYSREMTPQTCTKDMKPRCHFVYDDLTAPGELSLDGIHPSDSGYDKLGKMVWDLMQAEGMRR